MLRQRINDRRRSGTTSALSPRHIFLGVTEVAGYYGNLTNGFNEAGVKATLVDLSGHPFLYDRPEGQPRWTTSLSRLLARVRGGATARSPRWILWLLVRACAVPFVTAWGAWHCDVFIFGFGRSLMGLYDLPMLRLCRKQIVFVFHGSDARPSYLNGSLTTGPGGPDAEKLVASARRMHRSLRRIERWSDVVVVHATCAQFLSRPFVKSLAIGIPFRPPADLPDPSLADDGIVRVLHAPSSPLVKGTALIREAVASLLSEGEPIEYTEITGRPHREVLEQLAATDIVVDQAYSDSPLAGLSTEAAALGVPSIVAGYSLNSIAEQESTPGRLPPVALCEPDEIEDTLRALVHDSDRRRAIGFEAREFVSGEWAPEAVARRYLDVIRGDWPATGYQDPADVRYADGCGSPQVRTAEAVAAMVQLAGPSSLQVDDKPGLRQALLDLAEFDR